MAGDPTADETAAPPRRVETDPRLREMRHRFRNALQFLNSLVGLHARRTSDPQARHAFSDLRARLVTLSWIYDDLGDEGAAVQLSEFLPRLAHHVAGLHDSGARHELAFDLTQARVSTDRAVTIGQILTELLVAIYGNAGLGPRRRIEVKLAGAGGRRLRLDVAGTGAGEPRDAGSADPLGMVVVQSLARNLDGQLDAEGLGRVALEFDAGSPPDDDAAPQPVWGRAGAG
jgi:chemotaxis family two-component system sensor kinase Cph1